MTDKPYDQDDQGGTESAGDHPEAEQLPAVEPSAEEIGPLPAEPGEDMPTVDPEVDDREVGAHIGEAPPPSGDLR